MSENKIFITGASGVGKTHLANWIAKEYDIPFISTSAKKVWPRFGFSDHAEAHRSSVKHPGIGWDYQTAVLEQRRSVLKGAGPFITDRSPIDNLAYLLLQSGFELSDSNVGYFSKVCANASTLGNKLIYIKYSDDVILENDGFRITSVAYQRMMDAVISMILDKTMINHKLDVIVINGWDLETRKNIIKKWLKR